MPDALACVLVAAEVVLVGALVALAVALMTVLAVEVGVLLAAQALALVVLELALAIVLVAQELVETIVLELVGPCAEFNILNKEGYIVGTRDFAIDGSYYAGCIPRRRRNWFVTKFA